MKKTLLVFLALFAGNVFSAEVPESLPLGSEQALLEYANAHTVKVGFNFGELLRGNPDSQYSVWTTVFPKTFDFDPRSEDLADKIARYIQLGEEGKKFNMEAGKTYSIDYMLQGPKREGYAWGHQFFTADESLQFPSLMYEPGEMKVPEGAPIAVPGAIGGTIIIRDESGQEIERYVADDSGNDFGVGKYYFSTEVFWARKDLIASGLRGELILEYPGDLFVEYNLRGGKKIVEPAVVETVDPEPATPSGPAPHLVIRRDRVTGLVILDIENFRKGVRLERTKDFGPKAVWEPYPIFDLSSGVKIVYPVELDPYEGDWFYRTVWSDTPTDQ